MTFGATIKCDNAAFDGEPGVELARILRDVADKLEQGYAVGPCFDVNGNRVGHWELA